MTTDDRSSAPPSGTSASGGTGVPEYEIRVAGHLGPRWTEWFDGLDVAAEDDGITVIRGPVVDQAALHGLLHRLRDIGVPLISLTRVPPAAETERPALPATPSPHHPSGATS